MKLLMFIIAVFGVYTLVQSATITSANNDTLTQTMIYSTTCYCPTTTVTTPTTKFTTPTTLTTKSTSPTPCTYPTASTLTLGFTTLTISTPRAAQPGEVQVTVKMTCSFNETYEVDYANSSSQRYKDYTSNIFNRMFESFLRRGFLRLIKILFRSLLRGSVIADMELITAAPEKSNVTDSAVTTLVSAVTNDAFGASANITQNIVTETVLITAAPTTTVAPPSTQLPQIGESPISIRLTGSFSDTYNANYSNPASSQYIAYTNQIFFKMMMAFQRNGLMRLIQIVYNSLVSGSVIADMILISSSTSTPTVEQVSTAMREIVKDGFNGSASIQFINVNILPVVTRTVVTPPLTLLGWHIALIVIFSIVIFVGIVLCILALIFYARVRNNKLTIIDINGLVHESK